MIKYMVSILIFLGAVSAAPVTLPQTVSFTDGGKTWQWANIEVSGNALNINDGSFHTLSDAFDRYGLVSIDGVAYSPSNDADLSDISVNSTVVGKLLTTETKSLSGLNVTRKILFFNTLKEQSGIARDVTLLQNPTANPITISLGWGGDLGSDNNTAVRGNSRGTASFSNKDIWVVTSDNPTTPGDPVLGHIAQGVSCVVNRPIGSVLLVDNAAQIFSVTVPANETVSLVHFIQMSETNAAGLNAAGTIFGVQSGATTAGLFADLTDQEKSQILNFGFSDCKADYRALVADALQKVKQHVALGKSGKSAITAATTADNLAQKYGDEIELRSGQTEDSFLEASSKALAAVKAAAKAGKNRASNFASLKKKADRALKNILNKVVAP